MSTLNTTVIVRDDSFVSHVFLAGDTPPAWAVEKITNPDVWATGTEKESEPPAADIPSAPSSAAKSMIPPRAGRGSSATAWAAYAVANGFDVDEDAKASDIRAALEEQGIPTE